VEAQGSRLKAKANANNVMRNFKNLIIWQKGMVLVDKLYTASRYFPDDERFGMRSQCTRAAVSIPSNIAEGCGRKSQKDYLRFIEIALASAYELETHLLIIEQRKWFPETVQIELIELVAEEQKMLTKFIGKLA
jgi:four helix bundle protein